MINLLKAINEDSYHITNLIPDYYPYNYDSFNNIKDGGDDMFDWGNQVSRNF